MKTSSLSPASKQVLAHILRTVLAVLIVKGLLLSYLRIHRQQHHDSVVKECVDADSLSLHHKSFQIPNLAY